MEGKAPHTGTAGSKKVLIFYSSETEPTLLDRYENAIQYLEETNTDVDIVDVVERREVAQEYDVVATPTVVVQEGESVHRHIGVVDGLRTILEGDIYGKSVLHQMDFRSGREVANDAQLSADAEKGEVEQALQAYLDSKGFDVEIEVFDTDAHEAEGRLVPREGEASETWHDRMEEFLGGFFTELFNYGVMGAETVCAYGDSEYCGFTVKEEE